MRWIWYVVAALWALDALRMRVRVRSIPVLPPAGPADAPLGYGGLSGATEVDAETRAAAVAYAKREGISLLDLIPADSAALLVMGLVQLVDPAAYRRNPIAKGHSSGAALVADLDLFARAGVPPEQRLDIPRLVEAAQRLKIFATDRAAVVVAPTLRAASENLLVRWPWFAAIAGRSSRFVLFAQGLTLAFLAAGLWIAPTAGLVALVAFHLQPLLVFGGLPLHPLDLTRTVLLRSPIELWNWARLLGSRITASEPAANDNEQRARTYADQLRNGLDNFFEPRRNNCPLCGSSRLVSFLRTTDLVQHKPGRFVLEQCRECEHIFQNPRLSSAGLAFYYGDFYEGLGTAVTEALMGAPMELYLTRARLVDGLSQPRRWLDVGTAHGHFCCAAQRAWPEARFDGLDISHGIEQAERAGWVTRGYRGFLPDVAGDLASTYDVVSLFHCLEHTPDPRAEIAAAHTVLEPGGLLVIEVPDPECPMGRIFGRFWFPWFQPQHLHLLSVKNLTKLLREAGFEPAIVQRGPAHIRLELTSTMMMFLSWLSPRLNAPWQRRPGRLQRTWNHVVWGAASVLIPLAMVSDHLAAPFIPDSGCRMPIGWWHGGTWFRRFAPGRWTRWRL